jgi:hypothetical protein
MSVARNSISRFPYYTYKDYHNFGNGMNGIRVLGAAASPTMMIVVGMNSAASTSTMQGGGSRIKTSTDGLVWSNVATTSFGTNAVTQIAYGNDTFVAMGGSNTIATSPGTSGTTWTQRTSPAAGTNPWGYLTFQNGLFIATNGATGVFTSTDGITWTAGASITVSSMTSWNSTGRGGGIFYIENNPSSARWLQVRGQTFAATSATQFEIYENIASTGTTYQNFSNSNAGSYGAQWIEEDDKLIVSVSSNTTAGFNGHASVLNTATPTGLVNQDFPTAETPAGIFFPSVLPTVASISIGSSTASAATSQFSDFVTIAQGAAGGGHNTKKALYVYNDGYYNCLYVSTAVYPLNSNYGGVLFSPTANVVFRADDPSYAESVQVIGSGVVPQAGVSALGSSVGARSGGFERAVSVKFKENSYVFFVWFDNNSYWNHGYMRGTRTIKPLRTTIGLRI